MAKKTLSRTLPTPTNPQILAQPVQILKFRRKHMKGYKICYDLCPNRKKSDFELWPPPSIALYKVANFHPKYLSSPRKMAHMVRVLFCGKIICISFIWVWEFFGLFWALKVRKMAKISEKCKNWDFLGPENFCHLLTDRPHLIFRTPLEIRISSQPELKLF